MIITILFWSSLFFLFYVYFGYPLLVYLFAQLKKKPEYKVGHYPAITLIIAAYQESLVIGKKIENSLQLDYPPEKLEIVIAVDGIDSTKDVVELYTDKRVKLDYSPERKGKKAAITRCVEKANGDIIVLSDANNMYEPQTLKALAEPFTDPEIGAVSGSKRVIKDTNQLSNSEGLYWKYESLIKKMETRLGNCTAASCEIIAFRKELYSHPPKKGWHDDFYYITSIMRKGFRVVYASDAKSYERVSKTPQDEVTRRSRIVTQRCQMILNSSMVLPFNNPVACWQIISHKFFRTYLPAAMIILLISNGLAIFFNVNLIKAFLVNPINPSFELLFLMVQFSFYSLAYIGKFIPNTSFFGKVLYLPFFIVNSNLAIFLGIVGFLQGQKIDIWKKVERVEV